MQKQAGTIDHALTLDLDFATLLQSAEPPEEEAEWIAGRVNRLIGKSVNRGGGRSRLTDRPSSQSTAPTVALLYRTNAQSRPVEQALIFHEIPYRIFGGPSFYDRKEIRDIVAALRFATNPQDGMSAERLQKSFPQKVHRPLLETLKNQGGTRPLLELIDLFLSSTDYFGFLEREFPNAEERKENVNELIAFAGGFSDAGAFLERVSLLTAHDAPAKRTATAHSPNTVNLMSIHLAKGLEFDAVFVAGVAEGLLPHHRSFARSEELEEERRLMYVAVTRARRLLTLSFSGLPSRFLYEIPPELTEFTSPEGTRRSLPDEDETYIE